MTEAAVSTGIALRVSDVSGQKRVRASRVPPHSTVGELIGRLLPKLGLAKNDADGRPLAYRARLERDGRHLRSSETVGEVLQDEDALTLQPSIDAGGS